MAKPLQFTVVIDGLTLTADQQHRINQAIQSAALVALANFGVKSQLSTNIPRDWIGIVVGRFREPPVQVRAPSVARK